MNGCDLPVAVLVFHSGSSNPSLSATSGFHLLQENQIISIKLGENIVLKKNQTQPKAIDVQLVLKWGY